MGLNIFAPENVKKAIYIILFFYAVIAALTIIFFNGTGDAGDSVLHYLYARYAPLHPALYFDHWAKPVYVLLSSPFAHFGFTGIKIFNAIVTLATLFFTTKTASALGMKNASIVPVFMIFAPLYYILTFSGLTEPLFALFTSVGIYLAIRQRFLAACLIVSFLPFVRSEGLIMAGVFALFLAFKKQWKFIPFLLTGSAVYSIAGYFVHHDLLWIFSKIPYASMDGKYGSGKIFHFIDQLFYVVGVPVFVLFWTGFINMIIKWIKKKTGPEEIILIFLGTIFFITAHSLFWYLGIFNSMGLKRVLIGIIPLVALIALAGFNFLTEDIFGRKKSVKVTVQALLLAYVVIFPLTSNPASIKWENDMMLSRDQQSAKAAADFILDQPGGGHRILCAHPYLSVALDIDHFDSDKRLDLTPENIERMPAGDIFIWENWFVVVEMKITKEALDNDITLTRIYNSDEVDRGREIIYSIYIKKP